MSKIQALKEFQEGVQSLFRQGFYYKELPPNLIRKAANRFRMKVDDLREIDGILNDLYAGRWTQLVQDLNRLVVQGVVKEWSMQGQRTKQTLLVRLTKKGNTLMDLLYGPKATPLLSDLQMTRFAGQWFIKPAVANRVSIRKVW